MNDMVDEGILDLEDRTGKGGHHKAYYPKMNRKQFGQHVVDTITKKEAQGSISKGEITLFSQSFFYEVFH